MDRQRMSLMSRLDLSMMVATTEPGVLLGVGVSSYVAAAPS